MRQLRYFLTFFLVLVTGHVSAAEIYVSTTGKDGNAGTMAAPLLTLAAARDKADQLKAGGPVNVIVRGGVYYLSETLVFGPSNSGTAQAPIAFSAYPGETPVLSGGVKITPSWTAHSGGIMVADIGSSYDFDMLFLGDDKLLIMARWPNFDASEILQGHTNQNALNSRLSSNNPNGGFVRAIQDHHWGSVSYKITGPNPSFNNGNDLEWVGDNNRHEGAWDPDAMMMENIFKELDAPGEWYYNKSAGKLYVYPPAGTSLNGKHVVGATVEELIKVEGTDSERVSHLKFSGFNFTHAHRTLFTRKYERLISGAPNIGSDWAIARAGAIFIQKAENITIENSDFNNVGGNGVFISAYNKNHLIANCDFTNLGASAVAIIGDPSAMRHLPDETPGPANDKYPANITVTHCYMFNHGMFEKQTSAVTVQTAHKVTVRHTTAHYGPRAGFNIGNGNFGGHIWEYNELFNQMRETRDHGPFNAWMRDRWDDVRHNEPDRARRIALIDFLDPIIVRNNRVSHPTLKGNYGIDWDDGSSNFEVYNNLLINAPVKMQRGFFQKVSNNIFVNALPILHQWKYPDMNKYITHNIIVNNEPYFCRSRDFFPNTGRIDSNVFWNNGDAVKLVIEVSAGQDGDATQTWNQYNLDEHSVTADPMFVDPSKCNYQVKAGSPALTLGFQNFAMNEFGKPGGYPTYNNCPGSAAAPWDDVTSTRHYIGEKTRDVALISSPGRLIIKANGDYTVTIADLQGKKLGVYRAKNSSPVKVNTAEFQSGLYIALVHTSNGIRNFRFLAAGL